MPKLMSYKEAREYLGVSRATFYRLVQGKRIPAFKIGGRWRINKESLDKWFEEKEKEHLKTR